MSRSPDPSDPRSARVLIGLLVAIGVLRLVSLPLYPLIDRTESRYAEIAREMVADGDWISPQLCGEPFWGKPPLATWAQAVSIQCLGAHELAVRLPGWIAGLGIAALVWQIARLRTSRERAWIATAVFAAAPLSIGMAGAAMTDPYLVLGVTLALFGLATWLHARRAWRSALLFGGGLALGTLAKGPIAVVFGGAPLVVLLLTRRGRSDLRGWPWVRAACVFLGLAVPWFLVAEARTPGFLEYFFVGEHFHRFVDPHWQADRYGRPHAPPWGAIWLFFAIGFATWMAAVFLAGVRRHRRADERAPLDSWGLALWASMLAPLVLFTVSNSVLLPYAFPAIPPASLLLARRLRLHDTRMACTTVAVLCLSGVVALCFVPPDAWARWSHKSIVSDPDARRIIYCRKIDTIYSATFYSRGRAMSAFAMNNAQWNAVRSAPSAYRFATKGGQLFGVPEDLRPGLAIERQFAGGYQLWRARPIPAGRR